MAPKPGTQGAECGSFHDAPITLFLNPEADRAEQRDLSSMLQEWHAYFQARLDASGLPVQKVMLQGAAVTRQSVVSMLAQPRIEIVFFMGHGLPCCLLAAVHVSERDSCAECLLTEVCPHLCGDEPILDPANYELLRGRLIFMIACGTARQLGRKLRDLTEEKSGFFAFDGDLEIWPGTAFTTEMREIICEVLLILHDRRQPWRERYARARRFFLDRVNNALVHAVDQQDWFAQSFFEKWERAFDSHPPCGDELDFEDEVVERAV